MQEAGKAPFRLGEARLVLAYSRYSMFALLSSWVPLNAPLTLQHRLCLHIAGEEQRRLEACRYREQAEFFLLWWYLLLAYRGRELVQITRGISTGENRKGIAATRNIITASSHFWKPLKGVSAAKAHPGGRAEGKERCDQCISVLHRLHTIVPFWHIGVLTFLVCPPLGQRVCEFGLSRAE